MSHDSENFDVIILGAGVSGLASAFFLSRSGLRVCLLDDYPSPGGNHISVDLNGFTFDIGSIFFFPDNPQFKMYPDSAKFFVPVRLAMSRITPQGDVRSYPLSVQDELLKHPIVFLKSVASLAFSRLAVKSDENAETYAIYHMGRYFYRRSGLENYLSRFYGVNPSSINMHFVGRRMNLAELSNVRTIMRNILKSMIRGRTRAGNSKPSALARPPEGFSRHYERVAEVLRAQGVEIRCAAGLKTLREIEGGLEVSTASGKLSAKRVVNTLPLKKVFELIGKPELVKLSSSTLCTLCCSSSGPRNFQTAVLYNFHDDGAWKRLTMHSDYYGTRDGRDFFIVEVTLVDEKPEPHRLFDDFVAHVQQLGLFLGDIRLEGHMVLDFAYPVCDMQAENHRIKLIELLEQSGIESIGRQGLFEYIPHSSIAIEAAHKRFGEGIPWVPFSGPM